MNVAIGAKLIGPHGGLQVDKQTVGKVTGSADSSYCWWVRRCIFNVISAVVASTTLIFICSYKHSKCRPKLSMQSIICKKINKRANAWLHKKIKLTAWPRKTKTSCDLEVMWRLFFFSTSVYHPTIFSRGFFFKEIMYGTSRCFLRTNMHIFKNWDCYIGDFTFIQVK